MQAFRWLAFLVAVGRPGGAQSTAVLELDVHARRAGEQANFVLARDGEELFANGELGLVALDAGSLAVRWSAGPCTLPAAPLAHAFAPERTWHAPALTSEVVVAALLLPEPRGRTEEMLGIELSSALPDRRLHGHARATGVELWSHAPRGGVARGELRFAERMTLLTPPLAVGERVLVACTEDGSSIDYWLAAYDARDGALAWKAFVMRGQIERNMLGGQMRDHPTPPLVATPDGAGAVAVTGLGEVVRVDARTGDVSWNRTYPAVPLPRTRVYTPIGRRTRWRTAPPLVVGDVVLVAPPDGRTLCAFDLLDGTPLWELDEKEQLERFGCLPPNDTLVAAAEGFLLFGGRELTLVRLQGDLRRPESFELAWSWPSTSSSRALLHAGRLFVPDDSGVVLHDLSSGAPLGRVELDARLGFRLDGNALTALGRRGFAEVLIR